MKYLAFRFDDPQNIHNPVFDSQMVHHINVFIDAYGQLRRATFGHEVAVKTKKHHFHYHIEIDNTSPREGRANKTFLKGMSSKFKRYMEELNLKIKNYSIKEPKELAPSLQWFGYLFKDIPHYDQIHQPLQHGFTSNELKSLHAVATALRKKSLEEFNKHENKLNNDKLMWSKLSEYIDNEVHFEPMSPVDHGMAMSSVIRSNHERDKQKVGVAIIEYMRKYNDHKLPNKANLLRYIYKYFSEKDIHSTETLYQMIMR